MQRDTALVVLISHVLSYCMYSAVALCNIQRYIARSESSTTFNSKPSGEAFGATFHGMA